MARLICGYFHSEEGQSDRARILALFCTKICVFDVKTYFHYVKSQEDHLIEIQIVVETKWYVGFPKIFIWC